MWIYIMYIHVYFIYVYTIYIYVFTYAAVQKMKQWDAFNPNKDVAWYLEAIQETIHLVK